MSDLEGRLFIRRAQGFVPADIMAEDAMNKVAVGSTVMLTVRRPRNPAHHRKLFALDNGGHREPRDASEQHRRRGGRHLLRH